jgi:site-specific recombinase XerD
MKTNQEYINEYLNRLQFASQLSPGTIKQYRSRLNSFESFINKSLVEVKCADIEAFLSGEVEEKATKQFKQSVICNFYNWMCDHDYVPKHPLMNRLRFGAEEKMIEFLEQEQLNIVNDLLRKQVKKTKTQATKFIQERNYVLFNFMVGTGVRSSEVLNIKKSDLNLDKNEVLITRKRNKKQIISFKYNLGKTIKVYLEQYPNDSEYLFPTRENGRMSKNTLDAIFKNINKKTGITIHPHMTRSTFACLSVDNGMDALELQKHLGHENPQTTQIYFKIRDKRVKEAIDQFAPDVAL